MARNLMPCSLDRTDTRILDLLQRDGRISNAELAERVNLSPSACLRRVQRLEAERVIESYAAVLDPVALGRTLQIFVRVQLERHDRNSVQSFSAMVAGWPEVVACWSLTGDMDYLLHVQVADLAHFNRFLMDELLARADVRDVNSSFVLATVKKPAGLPLPAL